MKQVFQIKPEISIDRMHVFDVSNYKQFGNENGGKFVLRLPTPWKLAAPHRLRSSVNAKDERIELFSPNEALFTKLILLSNVKRWKIYMAKSG